ncbi:MAG TPA: DegT/DnrJ/EryC1/StrS family aminotransferase [Polyangiaceae bacterium]|nr:DegT/DnrJ/EryC1/StrS family aminotransferase [Polyangiaceae bacterium]
MKPPSSSTVAAAKGDIPFFDLSAQTSELMDEIRPALERVLQSQRFILGEEVAAFEREIADYLGVRYAIGVSSGTDALVVALSALGIGQGDEVITTPYSFFATTGAILRVGATPVFVDIEPDSFNLNAESVSAALTPRTRAILPVHLFGQAADMRALRAIASDNQLALIEDAAQALGATLHGAQVGSLGDMACFSFFPTKNLGAFGDGGLVTTNDEKLAELARSLRGHGFIAKHFSQRLGGNYRLDALQAAVLRVKLRHLDGFNARRRKNARYYLEAVTNDELMLPLELPGRTHVYHQFVVRSRERDALAAHLLQHGIRTEQYYPFPIHLQPACASLRYGQGSFPEAESAAQESLALPIFPELEDWMLNSVADALGSFSPAR